MTQNILEVRNLVKHFETSNSFFTGKKNIIKAVDEVRLFSNDLELKNYCH